MHWSARAVAVFLGVIPNPAAFLADGGEGSAFPGPDMSRTYCVYILASWSAPLPISWVSSRTQPRCLQMAVSDLRFLDLTWTVPTALTSVPGGPRRCSP